MKKEKTMAKKKIQLDYIWQDRKRWALFGIPWTFTRYGLTEEKFVIKKGFLNLTTDEVRLYRILDVSLRQGLFQRMFNLGTLKVASNDKSLGAFEIKNVKNPEYVKETLSQKVEEERVRKRVASREYFSGDTHDGGDYYDDDDLDDYHH